MNVLKITLVAAAVLALGGCIVEPYGGGPGYYSRGYGGGPYYGGPYYGGAGYYGGYANPGAHFDGDRGH